MAELLSYAIQECAMPSIYLSLHVSQWSFSFIYIGSAYFSYVKFIPKYCLS